MYGSKITKEIISMFKLTVTNPLNVVLHSATYPDLATAEFWKNEIITENEWNFPTRTEIVPEFTEVIPATPEVLDLDGVTVLVPAQPEQTIVSPAYEIQVPDVTITIEDITVQTAYENEIQKRVKRMNFATQLFAELAVRNVDRLKAGLTDLPTIIAAEAKLVLVQRYMANSSLEIALQNLIALDIPEMPADEKTYFIGKIQSYLSAE